MSSRPMIHRRPRWDFIGAVAAVVCITILFLFTARGESPAPVTDVRPPPPVVALPRPPSHTLPQSLYQLKEVDRSAYSQALSACAEKILACTRQRGGNPYAPQSICLHSSTTDHTPSQISLACTPSDFSWNRKCTFTKDPFHLVTSDDLARLSWRDRCGCAIVMVMEPPAVSPEIRRQVDLAYEDADLILSSYAIVSDPKRKVFPFTYGSTWIKPEERQVYPKTAHMSIIASAKTITAGHRMRHEIITRFSHKVGFDVMGGGYKKVERKVDMLAPYRFSVIIENTQEEYWITEKLIDAFLTGTVPIYWGAGVVPRLFDTRGILFFKDVDDFGRVVELATKKFYDDNIEAIRRNFHQAERFACPEDRIYEDLLLPLDVITSALAEARP